MYFRGHRNAKPHDFHVFNGYSYTVIIQVLFGEMRFSLIEHNGILVCKFCDSNTSLLYKYKLLYICITVIRTNYYYHDIIPNNKSTGL